MSKKLKPVELLHKRTEKAKYFDNGDGTKTAKIHLLPIHYDDGGLLKDINPELKVDDSPTDNSHYVDEAELKIAFNKIYDEPNIFQRDGFDPLVLIPLKANPVEAIIEGNKATYYEAYTSTDVEQESTGRGLKENIILKDKGHPSRFSYSFSTSYAPKVENGHIIFTTEAGELAYRVSSLVSTATPESKNFGLSFEWQIEGDTIYFDVNDVPEYPLVIDPSVSPYSAAGDGSVSNMTASSSWSSCRSAGTGTAKDDTGVTNIIQTDVGFSGEKGLRRMFWAFDTSGIGSGQAVSAATLNLYGSNKSNFSIADPDLYIVSGTQASTSSLATSDFGSVGTTSFGSKTYSSWSNAAYNSITLNSSGQSAVNMTGYTKLAGRMGNDYNNTDPGTSFASGYLQAYCSEQSGTSNDPYLSVTYSAAGTTQTITGKANIVAVVTKTTTGKSRITATTTKTITGKANIIPITTTQTIKGRAAITLGTTLTKRFLSGKITHDACSATTKFTALANGGSISTVSGALKITASANTFNVHVDRYIYDLNSIPDGQHHMFVRNAAITVDMFHTGGHNAYAGVVALSQDSTAQNAYYVTVANTAGGTSTLWEVKSGTATSRATVAKGIAADTWKTVKFSRIGNVLTAIIDGSSMTWTDSGTPLGATNVLFGAPNDGTGNASDCRIDNLDIAMNNTITVRGVPTGGSVRLYDSGGSTIASSTETSNVASLDVGTSNFPITGYLKVFTDSYTTEATTSRFPASGNDSNIRGADEYYYNLTDFDVITTEGNNLYATSQVASHNGVIMNGDAAYGLINGYDGRVTAWYGNTVTKEYYTYEIEPEGYIADSHAPTDIQVDSNGYFHIIYGGYFSGQALNYRMSTNPWDVTSWSSATNIGNGAYGGLHIDQNDKLHLIGSQYASSSINGKAIYASKASGGSWSAITTLINAYSPSTGWELYYGDSTIGKETSGQKSLHATWFVYGPGTATGTSTGVTSTTLTDTGAFFSFYTLVGHRVTRGSSYAIITSHTGTVLTFSGGWVGGTPSNGAYTVDARYLSTIYMKSLDGGSTWKSLTGSSISVPVTQASDGSIAGPDVVINTEGSYTLKIATDDDNVTIHGISYDLLSGDVKYYKGDTTGGWAASSKTFTQSSETVGTIEKSNGQLIYLSSRIAPNKITVWVSSDSGSTWGSETALITGLSAYPPEWYWPKMTPIGTTGRLKVVWQGRYTSYLSDATGVTGEGVASLYFADIYIVSVKNITGKASISVTTTKTITGKSNLNISTPRTITGVSRITATTPQTITGTSRITATTTKTISGVSRVTVTTQRTISGVSHIEQTTTQTIDGVSRVTATTTKTITGKSNIYSVVTTTQTIDGTSSITNTSTKTISGKASILSTVSAPSEELILLTNGKLAQRLDDDLYHII